VPNTFIGFELGQHPQIRQKIQVGVNEYFPNSDSEIGVPPELKAPQMAAHYTKG